MSKKMKKPEKPVRTTAMTVAIIYVILHGILFTAISWAIARNGELPQYAPILTGILVVTSIADVAAGVGMWMWKRWGIYVFAASTIIGAAVILFLTGSLITAFGSIILPVVVLYIIYPKQRFFK
ncbi:MAG: hypothetical protein J5I90_03960 [Caldilineales bacterium]|nr:hypothetical protein [Caldilineales bacterium]